MVVLITGASSGVGKFTAQAFVKKGHIVYGTSRDPRPENTPEGVRMLALDVREDTSCHQAVAQVLAEQGRIDVLVNNAGMGIAGAVELTSDEEAQAQFATNFFGALNMCRAVMPAMRAQGGGRILFVSSVAACIPIPFQAMYSAGKAALEAVSHAIAMEAKLYGIKTVALEFGDMKTGFTKHRVVTEQSRQDEGGAQIYTKVFQKSLATMERDEQKGPEPIKAARLIVAMATKKHPKPLVVCGFSYKLVAILRRFLPLRLSNWMIGLIYSKG